MQDLIPILVTWLVTAVSLFIISKLPTGVEIDGFNKALISSAVFGLLNALLLPLLKAFTLPFALIFSRGLIGLLLNLAIFGLSAWLVEGFRLRWGFWSALIGAIALVFINSLLFQVLASAGLVRI